MKTGLQGLASKIDEVQGKAAEDLTALAHKAGAAWSQASSVASDLSARLTDAERQQAAAKAAADRAQAASDAALLESAQARRDQQIARAQFEADLQAATLQSQAAADRAALQAAQASADARSATVEVPRLDATVLQLQSELRAMQVASQQAQERSLRLESELSAAQDRIGAAERKAAQAERRHSLLQKRMDDWDAFDPDLHAALNASMQSPPLPTVGQLQQLMQTDRPAPMHPAGSETTVQSAQQVHAPQGQPQATSLDDPCKQAHHNLLEALMGFLCSHLCNRHKHLHSRCNLHQLDTMEMLWTVLLALMSHSGQLVLEEAAVARMEVVLHPHSLPMLAPTSNRDRVRRSPYR